MIYIAVAPVSNALTGVEIEVDATLES